jgi:MerR family transcriptional regulator/heat shock protein HspR
MKREQSDAENAQAKDAENAQADWKADKNIPLYGISVVARLLDCNSNTLRRYEKAGLIKPSRTAGNTRMYSEADIDLLKEIHQMVGDDGVNKRGARVVMELRNDVHRLEDEVQSLKAEIKRLKSKKKSR